MAENFGPRVNLILMDCSLAKELVSRTEAYERDWEGMELFKDLIGGPDMVSKPNWKRSRRVVSMMFNFEAIKERVPAMVEIIQDAFKDWVKEGKLDHFEMVEHMAGITGNITGQAIFGKAFNEYKVGGGNMSDSIQSIFAAIYNEFFSPSILSIIFGPNFYKTNILERHRKLNKSIKELRIQSKDMLNSVRASGKREKNLFWALIDDSLTGEPDCLNDDQILSEFIGLFAAGTETTSYLISTSLYFLWKYPDVFEKVKAEVDKTFKDVNSLSLESVNQMEYMSCFIKESLRMGGPSAVLHPRVTIQDDELGGVKIKKGTMINYYHFAFYLSEKYFSDATEFKPERWLPKSAEGYKTDPFSYIPFSAGARNCIGQHLAQIEAKMVLGMFIKTFDFKFPKDYKEVFIQRGMYQPYEPLVATLTLK